MKKIRVLMCGSKLTVGGGVVSVTKNYLNCKSWDDIDITYLPTHDNGSQLHKFIVYIRALTKIIFSPSFKSFDIAHLHTTENGSFYRKTILMRLLQKRGIKVILHHHIDYQDFYSKQNRLKKKWIDWSFEKADVNIVLGKNLVDFIKEKSKKDNVIYVYNAVETFNRNRYNQNAKNILFFGWLIERKGITDFLMAIKKLDSVLPDDIKVCFCGDGDKNIYEKINSLGIISRISHIGWIDYNEKSKYLNEAIVNVLPSYREGLPMTILETMAYGIPNIASNIAIIPEAIDNGRNGYLVEPGDVDNLVDKIQLIVNNDKLRQELSENSYKTIAEKFCIGKHLEIIRNVYYSLTQTPHP